MLHFINYSVLKVNAVLNKNRITVYILYNIISMPATLLSVGGCSPKKTKPKNRKSRVGLGFFVFCSFFVYFF